MGLKGTYLEEFVMVELDPVLQPGDLRSRDADRHAEERDLSAQHVVQLKVGRLHDLGTLRKKNPWQMMSRGRALDTQMHILAKLTSLFS